jgi:DNA-binding CsgD family transcriptional regulator
MEGERVLVAPDGVPSESRRPGARQGLSGTRRASVSPGQVFGRDAELAKAREALRRLADGVGAVVVIEGAAGIGKSRLLAEISAIASETGIAVGAAVAQPTERLVELSALLEALFAGPVALLDSNDLAGPRPTPEQRFWLLRDLHALLERAAMQRSLMICIDDAQWADGGTVAALRALPAQLADVPIAWVVAVRPLQESRPLATVLEQLSRNGATTLALGPLVGEPVAQMAADLLGAQPDDAVLELVDEAQGSPFLLVELLLGLFEEGRIRVSRGHAELIDRQLPNRVQEGMRERLDRLSDSAATVATVAASLAPTFSFGDLSRTVGWQASSLLGPVDELLRANVLVESNERLRFWHDITREAVRASVPASARRALDRQAAEVLLEAGALPVEVAPQLAASAEPGDELAIATLLEAAQVLLTSDPLTAAQFGRRALELAPAQHPRRGEIVGNTAIALHIAGNSDEAIEFADTALRQTLPAEQEAEVGLSIAGMFAISPEIRELAGRRALALPGISDVLRARHLACLVHNLVTAGRVDDARENLIAAETVVEASADVRARFTLRVAESAIEYADDSFGPCLDLIASAHRDGIFAGDDQRLRLAHMWHGELLSVHDRHEEALAIAAAGLASAQRDRQGWAYQMFETWHGRMLLRIGQTAHAAAILEGRYALEDGSRAAAVLDAAGIVALGKAALHSGDTRQVRRLTGIARIMLEQGTPAVRRHAAWLLAVFELSAGDPHAARDWIRVPADPGARPILPRFPVDIADEVQLARIALATDDDDLAKLALANAQQRADRNPGIPSISAVASHVRGLLAGDEADVSEAVALFAKGPRRLEHAAALEDLGVSLGRSDHARQIDAFSRALIVYTEAGATWDARRVRSHLRALGVRRRIVTVEPTTNGWAAITPAELAVARLVADGLTNRQIAERLFLSPHTVNAHLRHTFTKLAINSRVTLARFIREHDDE